jgi:hypothetical protein
MPFIISRVGARTDNPYNDSYKAIRDAEAKFARTYPNVSIGWIGAINGAARRLMNTTCHYNRALYNEMRRRSDGPCLRR